MLSRPHVLASSPNCKAVLNHVEGKNTTDCDRQRGRCATHDNAAILRHAMLVARDWITRHDRMGALTFSQVSLMYDSALSILHLQVTQYEYLSP